MKERQMGLVTHQLKFRCVWERCNASVLLQFFTNKLDIQS